MRKKMTIPEMIAAACRSLKCCLNGLFKRAFSWKLGRQPGLLAQHAHSLYANGGSLHRFIPDFLRHKGFAVA